MSWWYTIPDLINKEYKRYGVRERERERERERDNEREKEREEKKERTPLEANRTTSSVTVNSDLALHCPWQLFSFD